MYCMPILEPVRQQYNIQPGIHVYFTMSHACVTSFTIFFFFFCKCKTQQARIHRFLEKKAEKEEDEEVVKVKTTDLAVRKELERLRKKVNQLIKKQKIRQVRDIVKKHDESMPWGPENQVKVSVLLTFLLIDFIMPCTYGKITFKLLKKEKNNILCC